MNRLLLRSSKLCGCMVLACVRLVFTNDGLRNAMVRAGRGADTRTFGGDTSINSEQ
jgi:hypothetical protein